MESFKPWDQLTADEKIERLRHDLSSFVERSDEQNTIRHQAVDALKTRLAATEAELKRIAARLGKMER